ncbi:probable chitinase 10 [Neocloeon triangulifer]|uniref:probable chitinase 10 n=1 Tax=Neocloeon triangulifer TaxID=2078957 RepID=UPI00286EF3ED|nr:probable chitinase 10 [Neocloeon triangulifer]
MDRLIFAVVVLSQVARNFCSQSPECAPNQEIICPSNSTFAWCLYTLHQDPCPKDLFCDPSLPYICSEDPPVQPPTAIPDPDAPSDEYPLPGSEDGKTWNANATPPSTCDKPGRFPDVDDCSVFHMCLLPNLTHMQVSCPQGSHFSAKFGKCVEPERAKCEPQFQDFHCSDIGPVPDPEDCSSFRICHPDDTWRKYSCPSGSTFNARLSRCSTGPEECDLRDLEEKQKFVCVSKGLYPDLKDCRKFHMCLPLEDGSFAQGQAICPRNSVFNEMTKRCTIDLSVCNNAQKFCHLRHAGRYPSKEGCASFYWCGPGGAYQEYVCPYGSNFDPRSGRCEYESKSHCSIHHFNCGKEGKFPDVENDCDGFFVCLNFNNKWKVQRYRCPQGTKFDVSKARCLPKEMAVCHKPVKFL